MHRRELSAFLAVGAVLFSGAGYGQFTDPRTYANTPVDVNQLELDYAQATADDSIDTSLVIGGAHLEINETAVAYTRTFSFQHHLTWIKPNTPFAHVGGYVAGTALARSVTGAGDASLQVGHLFLGGSALDAAAFEKYQPTTTVGASLTVSGPSGQYDPNRVLNLGTDRWSVKPEIGVSHPFGPDHNWVLDGYINAYLFSDDNQYHDRQLLRQEPLPSLEAHISYNFTPDLWTSLDTDYSFRGTTFVDGVDQYDAQKRFTIGTETYWTLHSRHTITFLFAKSIVHIDAPMFTEVALKYFYNWGSGDQH